MKYDHGRWIAVLCALAGFTAAGAGQARAEEVRIGGGAAPIENIFKKIKAPFENETGVKMTLSDSGPDKAFIDLEAGKVDIAAAGLSMKDWLDLMAKKGHPIADAKPYKQRVVGRDRIQVLAHSSASAVKSLNKEQLKDIFTGKIDNWKQVGGPDQAIVIIYGTKIPGTNKVWQEKVLDGAEWSKKNIKEATETTDVKRQIIATPGAIGIGPVAAEDSQIHSPKTPDIGRPITAITKGAPSATVAKVFKFIEEQGSKYLVR